jgi:hypothetical protein
VDTFCCSVKWLGIEDEKPYFYIFYYWPPVLQLITEESRKRIDRRIKEVFNGYSRDENACVKVPIYRRARHRIINLSKKFSLRAS